MGNRSHDELHLDCAHSALPAPFPPCVFLDLPGACPYQEGAALYLDSSNFVVVFEDLVTLEDNEAPVSETDRASILIQHGFFACKMCSTGKLCHTTYHDSKRRFYIRGSRFPLRSSSLPPDSLHRCSRSVLKYVLDRS